MLDLGHIPFQGPPHGNPGPLFQPNAERESTVLDLSESRPLFQETDESSGAAWLKASIEAIQEAHLVIGKSVRLMKAAREILRASGQQADHFRAAPGLQMLQGHGFERSSRTLMPARLSAELAHGDGAFLCEERRRLQYARQMTVAAYRWAATALCLAGTPMEFEEIWRLAEDARVQCAIAAEDLSRHCAVHRCSVLPLSSLDLVQ